MVVAVLAEVVAVRAHAVVLALHGVAQLAALDVLRQGHAVVLGQALKHRLQQDGLGAVADSLRGAAQLHAAAAQFGLVHGRVVAVSREAVQLVHVHDVEQAAARVGDHAQKAVAALGGAPRCGVVVVHAGDGGAVALGGLAAHAHLVLDGLLALARAAVPGVYDGVGHG